MQKLFFIGLFFITLLFLQNARCEQRSHLDFLPATAQNTITGKTPPFRDGDVYRGAVELANPRQNPAILSLYITHAGGLEDDDKEYDIEAIAVMTFLNTRFVYGLQGVYNTAFRQLNLYDVSELDLASQSISHHQQINTISFEPVGLAGKFDEAAETLHCSIAYNGNTTLQHVHQAADLDQAIETALMHIAVLEEQLNQ